MGPMLASDSAQSSHYLLPWDLGCLATGYRWLGARGGRARGGADL